MSPIRAVTFDCAGTLVRVDWQPARFAVDCAAKCGLELERGHAESVYANLLQARWHDYRELNRTRDATVLDEFWRVLTRDWLSALPADAEWLDPVVDQAFADLYGPESRIFALFEDAVSSLAALRDRGLRLAVLSNWDYSLHRVLRMLGIDSYFEVVAASLEEGWEKPDPRIFGTVLDRLGTSPEEALHVGDDPIDDVQGARQAGMRATLVDRLGEEKLPLRVTTLDRLGEVLDWTG